MMFDGILKFHYPMFDTEKLIKMYFYSFFKCPIFADFRTVLHEHGHMEVTSPEFFSLVMEFDFQIPPAFFVCLIVYFGSLFTV